tara:strand:+ start:2683 stop:4248 length:1566 start_codon:yes stop_codon:yes gene_type:complete
MTWEHILKSNPPPMNREEGNFYNLVNKRGFTGNIFGFSDNNRFSVMTETKTDRQITSRMPQLKYTLESGQSQDELKEWVNAFTRSMEFVSGIVDSNSEVEWVKNNVSVKGSSGKNYSIETTKMNEGCYEVITEEGVKICIILSEELPAGDNLGGLILTLLDDRSSQKKIVGISDYLNQDTYIECPFEGRKFRIDIKNSEGKCPTCQAGFVIEDMSFEPQFRAETEFYVDPINTDKFRIGRLSHWDIDYSIANKLFYKESPAEHFYNSDWVKPDDWNDEDDFMTMRRIITFKIDEPPFFTDASLKPLDDVKFGMSQGKSFRNSVLFKDGRELTVTGIAKIVKEESGLDDSSPVEVDKYIKTLFDFLVDYPFYYERYNFPMILGFEETEHKNVIEGEGLKSIYGYLGGYLEIILQPDNTHTVKNVGNPNTYEFYKSQKNLSSIAILGNNMKWTEYLKKSSTDNMESWEIALKSFIEEGKKIGVPLSVMEILQLAKEATTSQSEGFETLHRPTFSEDEEEEEDV